MKGVVTDEEGVYVKAAVVKLFRIKDSSGEQDSAASEAEAVTYAETDEEGRFVIQDLNPDEKYVIEIHAVQPEKGAGREDQGGPEGHDADDPDSEDKADDIGEEISMIDSLEANYAIDNILRGNASIHCSCNISSYDFKEKTYLKKTNLW